MKTIITSFVLLCLLALLSTSMGKIEAFSLHQHRQQQQQREYSHSWQINFNTGIYAYQPTKIDKQESFLVYDESSHLTRFSSSTGALLFNVSVPPESVTFPGESLVFEETSAVTKTSYLAVQQTNYVNVYSFNADHTTPTAPSPILQLGWDADQYGTSNNVFITSNDILIVPWLSGSDGYQLRGYDINPASQNTNRSHPIYSVSVASIASGYAFFAGGVTIVIDINSDTGRTQGFDESTGKSLWTFHFGKSINMIVDDIFVARESGFVFFTSNELSATLNALDARTGKIAFTVPTIEHVTSIAEDPVNPRQFVRLISFNLFLILDTRSGKIVTQASVGKQLLDTFQVLGGTSNNNKTRALVFHVAGNNSLWDLSSSSSSSKRLGDEIQWMCYQVNKPFPMEMCDRPLISSARSDESMVFTLFNPVPSGQGYFPTVLDVNTGATIATNTADAKYWYDAPDVIALSSSSKVAVYFGFGGTSGTSAVGYRIV